MGGLGPGVGGFEILVIGLVALLVVGPKDLPMLMRKVGQFVGKARAMANEFRASFDEMARQSELDELRKEVEALRSGQGMHALGVDADEAFKDIRKELEAPLDAPALTGPEPSPVATGVDEWPDAAAVPAPEPEPAPKPAAKPRAKKKTAETDAARPKAKRTKKVDL
ncbi:twin-arginine translocase subunit TatB [Brevundimonas naejangsanensis]|uniref:Sec-independent protein translocase protein TatB n=1 Tax=Brevundimonas naejangsanensis TaxID=588932 RepID=A0A494RLM9_9CAUL|nr:Sec-independent protein translocase protein TatB [Brevundimonas naejangsanensis]AYG95833.1 twin-arginine translocase subunit TatB [Brevundimonas naejangsanensis]